VKALQNTILDDIQKKLPKEESEQDRLMRKRMNDFSLGT